VIEKYYGTVSNDHKSWIPEDHKRKPCPFLKADADRKACAIYPVRPKGCRLYPFGDFGRGEVDCPAAKIVYERLEDEASSQDPQCDMS